MTLTAREYRRVSHDRSGRQRSVDEQADDNQRAADAQGFTLGAPYVDNGVSASRYSKKKRDDFARLLADLENDSFGAEVLQLWESSRGSRKVGEWVTLIELCEERAVKVFVTTHGRLYDPANPRDRRSLLEDAVDGEYEVSKVSARTRRTAAAEAAKGRPHGRPPYGFQREHDPKTGRLITWVPDTSRVPDSKHPEGQTEKWAVPVEVFKRLKAGHSLRAIAIDFKARGIVNESGTPFTGPHLRSMALKVAYIGKRVHKGNVVDGTWDGLIDEVTFYAVQRILSDPSRPKSRNGRAKHELSRIIRCGVCGDVMKVLSRDGDPTRLTYQCNELSCTRVQKAAVDRVVIGAMLAYLASDKVYADFTALPGDSLKAGELRGQVAALRLKLDEMEAATPEDLHEARVLARSTKALAEKITRLEDEERKLTLPGALSNLIQPGADVEKRWNAAPVAARREVARLLLTPAVLGQVRILRAGSGQRVDVVDRIEWFKGLEAA